VSVVSHFISQSKTTKIRSEKLAGYERTS